MHFILILCNGLSFHMVHQITAGTILNLLFSMLPLPSKFQLSSACPVLSGTVQLIPLKLVGTVADSRLLLSSVNGCSNKYNYARMTRTHDFKRCQCLHMYLLNQNLICRYNVFSDKGVLDTLLVKVGMPLLILCICSKNWPSLCYLYKVLHLGLA